MNSAAHRLVWEFPATGGVITSGSFTTVQLLALTTPFEIACAVLHIFWLLFALYFAAQLCVAFSVHGFCRLVVHFFFWIELLIVLVCLVESRTNDDSGQSRL